MLLFSVPSGMKIQFLCEFLICDRDMLLNKEGLFSGVNKTCDNLVNAAREDTRKALAALQSFIIPTYTEHQFQSFLNAMLQDGKHRLLAGHITALEKCLKTVKADSADLDVKPSDILPEFEEAQREVKRFLTVSCMTTCAKILCSKAASNGSATLKASLDATLDFAKSEGLDLPTDMVAEMSSVQLKLAKSSSASKKPAKA